MPIEHDHNHLLKRATQASVGVAIVLIFAKAGAYWSTQSAAVLGALFDSGIDTIASVVNLIAVRYAIAPADQEHRFGHGKAESLAGLAQALFIVGSAIALAVQSALRLANPRPIDSLEVGIGVMLFSMAATAALVAYQRRVVRITGSTAIAADLLHYAGDFVLHASVIVSLLLWKFFGLWWADGAFGVLIALWLAYGALQIASHSIQALMDRELPEEDRQKIKDIVCGHPKVLGLHDLRTRRSGRERLVQMHLELDGQMTLFEAHEIGDVVERDILNAFPAAEVLIHHDPAQQYDEHNPPEHAESQI